MDDFEKELKLTFLEEASQALADCEQCFLALETQQSDPTVIEKIFRLAHNIKGSARAVGFSDMGEFTHELESLLLKIKNRTFEAKTSTVNLLLRANDFLRGWVDALKANLDVKLAYQALAAEIKDHRPLQVESPAAETPAMPSSEAPSEPRLSAPEVQLFAPEAVKTRAPAGATVVPQDESIRVSLARLEKLLNNVGELVILQTVLNQQRFQIQSQLIQKTIGQLAKITKDIQDISMSLRMVPLKPTFQKMQRIVRDTAQSLQKNIQLEPRGEDTELDKTVVDHLGDPLVHLVRNACDHGLETTEERQKLGKPAQGLVTLSAVHQGGQMILEIRDDGRGLDPEKLKAKAREKGILRADQDLPDEDAYRLIFHPGFSTKAQVTEISGRGVGLDVVKTNIEEILRGEVQIETRLGQGTTFRIILPLTLAIIDGMVLRVGNDRYIVPLNHIHESLQPAQEDVHHAAGMGEILSLRGENMPLFRLSQLLGRGSPHPLPAWQCITVVVRVAQQPFAMLVDEIIGQQQVVIKKLGLELGAMRGVTGAAILGDGRAALILDLIDLVNRSQAHRPALPQTAMRGVA